MIKKILKVVSVAAVGSLFSSICVSASIIPGMDQGDRTRPMPINPVPDAPSSTSSYSDLDALLGFRVLSGTGIGFEGIIDLGPVSQFNHTFTLSLGDIGGFMSSNFGSDWYTRMTSSQVGKTDIQWAVVATDNNTGFTNDLWSTRNPAVRANPWTPAANQSIPSNDIDSVGNNAYSGQTIATGTTSAIKEASSVPNSWTSYQPGGANSSGISFGFFNPTNEGNTNTVLDFDYVKKGAASGVEIGTFTWNSDGTVLFTAVPEPSTYRLMALGAIGLIGLTILRRRRAARA